MFITMVAGITLKISSESGEKIITGSIKRERSCLKRIFSQRTPGKQRSQRFDN